MRTYMHHLASFYHATNTVNYKTAVQICIFEVKCKNKIHACNNFERQVFVVLLILVTILTTQLKCSSASIRVCSYAWVWMRSNNLGKNI